MLHADADFSIAVKSPVEAYDVGRVTLVQHLQLPNDLVPDGWFDFQVDQLENRKQVLFLFSCHTELEHKDINHVLVRTHAQTLDTIHVMILRKNVRIYGPMCWLVIQTFQPIWIDACKKTMPVWYTEENCSFSQCIHESRAFTQPSAYLPRHNQTGGSVGDLEDHPSVACAQLADLLEVIVLQLTHLLLLRQKGLQAFALLLIQLELL